jgi:8-oxo-dGTP pyrophosphatase MutT (NUDIX family)
MTTDEAARSTSGVTPRTRALRPRDAATLIIVDTSSGEARVLLGRRRLDMVFMPGRYVFPGGRVDRADRQIALEQDITADDLKDLDRKKLMIAMKGTASEARARALALAAVRETFEEAGLLLGRPLKAPLQLKAPSWQAFYAAGFAPALAKLSFFARAITPPGRPRRYDTRFFCVPAEAIVHRVAVADGELSDLEWLSIPQARTLELPNITRVVLEDLGERVAAGGFAAEDFPVPFYHRRNGSYRRDLITAEAELD